MIPYPPSARRVGARGFLAAALAVAMAAAISAGQAPSLSSLASRTGTGAITGVVVDAMTNRPVAGAIVSLSRLGAAATAPLPPAMTDAKGRFVFRDLPASPEYFLGARRFGYASTRYGWTGPDGPLTISDIKRVPVADGQWVRDITIPLWKFGSIEGRVTDERSEPVVGVAVRVFSTANVAGAPQLVGGPIATTDDRGVYRIAGLKPGRFVVGVLSVQSTVPASTPDAPQQWAVGELETGGIGASKGSTVSAPSIDVDGRHRLVITNFATPPPPSSTGSRVYAAQFHPGAPTPTVATPIDVDYATTRRGVDFQLVPVPSARVSGRLSSQTITGPFPATMLRLMPAGSERLGFGSEAATTIVEPDGRFTFLNVPEGQYTLLAQRSVMDFTTGSASIRFRDGPGFPGGGISVGSLSGAPGLGYLARNGADLPYWGRLSVSVGGRNLENLEVPIHGVVQMRGRVAYDHGTKPPPRGAFLRAFPANGDPSFGQPSTHTSPTDPTHAFVLTGLLGGRYLLTSDSYAYRTVSIVHRGRDVTDIGFDAADGQHFDDVVVTLTDRKVDITGVVTDRGVPAAAGVIAFPVERERWTDFGWEAARFRTTRSSTSGEYRLTPLPAGDYYVVAVDARRMNDWTNREFLAAVAPLATRVSATWGDVKTQHLTLVTVPAK
jgi:hypothetical protein